MRKFWYILLFCLSCVLSSCSTEEELDDIHKIVIKYNEEYQDDIISQDIAIINAYKKSQQFQKITWESIAPIPSVVSSTAYYSVGKHTGMPYSLANEYNKYIGYDVSIKTFMTALHNKHSLLYTENIESSRSFSAHGIEYKGAANYCAPYMGTVCSFYVSYVLGSEIPYHVYEYKGLEELGIMNRIENQSANGLQLMDIVWESGHVAIITNITHNDDGTINKITWSESVRPCARTVEMSPTQFNNRIISKKDIIYRYNNLSQNTKYEPSEFVAAFNEKITSYHYNDDICTFAGDFACFREGDIIIIDYEKGNYNVMELYKDDELIETMSLPADSEVHEVDLTDKNLKYGSYKARLCSNRSTSDYTYFEVIQADVQYEDYSDYQKVTFNSKNGTPIYIQLCNRSGGSYGKYILTDEDKNNGYALFNAYDLLHYARQKKTFGTTIYLKVFFQGEYGRVTNHFLKTELR